jgi:hypothetical protein
MITLALVVAAAVVLALAAGRANSDDGTAGDSNTVGESAAPSMPETTPESGGSAPSDPTVQVFDRDDCKGLSKPPTGAVEVSTEQNLADVVRAGSGQATYWLAPGVHRLGRDKYDQVQPHRGDTFIGAPRAILDGQHVNLYAFGGKAADVTIKFITVRNFGSAGDNNNEGVVNHDSAEGWTVDSSTIEKNAGAGLMLSSGNRVVRSCLRDNGQYGFNAYAEGGVKNVVLRDNEISGNNTDDWEKRREGCGCTGGGKFWETNRAKVTNNYVHDNKGVGLWADSNNVGFRFEGNYISGNEAEGIMYETSYNAAIVNNTFVRNALHKGPTNPEFPLPSTSRVRGDERVEGRTERHS